VPCQEEKAKRGPKYLKEESSHLVKVLAKKKRGEGRKKVRKKRGVE